MLLSFSTWGMQKTPVDVAVKHCAALGFDGLELTVIPRWPTNAATMDAAERKRIRKLYDDNNILLCGLSGNTPLLKGGTTAERAENVDMFTTYLDLAAELGDVHVQEVRLPDIGSAPDLLQERSLGEQLALVEREHAQQVELVWAQVHGLAADADGSLLQVDDDLAELDHRLAGRSRSP